MAKSTNRDHHEVGIDPQHARVYDRVALKLRVFFYVGLVGLGLGAALAVLWPDAAGPQFVYIAVGSLWLALFSWVGLAQFRCPACRQRLGIDFLIRCRSCGIKLQPDIQISSIPARDDPNNEG